MNTALINTWKVVGLLLDSFNAGETTNVTLRRTRRNMVFVIIFFFQKSEQKCLPGIEIKIVLFSTGAMEILHDSKIRLLLCQMSRWTRKDQGISHFKSWTFFMTFEIHF